MDHLLRTHGHFVKPVGQGFGFRIPSLSQKLAEAGASNWRASPTQNPWSLVVNSDDITCGVSAYAQLKSTSRFTTSIRLANPLHDPITALVDTGAERTCISTPLFNKMHTGDQSLRLFNPSVRLSGANGSPLSVKGAVRFPLALTPRISVTTDVIVCDNLSHDVILGLDVLISTRAVINMHEQSVMFRSPDPSVSPEYAYFVTVPTPETYLTLSEDVRILPREQKLVVVECTSKPLRQLQWLFNM